MKPLRAGDLHHRVAVRRAVRVKEGSGVVTSWTTIASPWAELRALDGREAVIEQVLQGISVFRVRMWWRDDIQPKDQLLLADGRMLNVRSVADPFGTRRELVIMADTQATLA